MADFNWVFIGAGNMAGSLIGGLINSGYAASAVSIFDINPDACEALSERYGVNVLSGIDAVPDGCGVVIAVKPHIVGDVCKALKTIRPSLLVSVAAGVREQTIAAQLAENTPIVRCMPNTPALLGLGATAIFANSRCSEEHRNQAMQLLATAGKVIVVENESRLDAVTALSGSGPAYFFYLIEHMINAGIELGLSDTDAKELAIETAFGAASMARQGEQSPATLRENVTSKGGTTAAALNTFNDHQMPDIISKAMHAAHHRAVELGDEFDIN